MASGYFSDKFHKEVMERQRESDARELKRREEAYLASKAEYERRARELEEFRRKTRETSVLPDVRSPEKPVKTLDELSLGDAEPKEFQTWLEWDDEPATDATQTIGKGRKKRRRSSKTKRKTKRRRSSRRN